MPKSNFAELYRRLHRTIPARQLLRDDLSLLVLGSDAGFYRLLPKLIVKVEDEEQVRTVLHHCRALNIPVTFRAAGTSLSGQSVSDSVLVALDQGWKRAQVLEGGAKISLQPGVIGAAANRLLLPYAKKIGPDPASIDAAMIGGIAANNASGMCCGTAQNSYRTLAGLRALFADGSLLDTMDTASVAAFRESHPGLLQSLTDLRQRILSRPALADRIRGKFKMKNTMGYSLNALVDYADPVDILQHLLIGSEGTLAFLSEIVYHTVPEYADKASALMIFPDIESACKGVAILKKEPVDAVELMDRAALRSVQDKGGMPSYLKGLDDHATALLVETRGADAAELDARIGRISQALKALKMLQPLAFTRIESEYSKLWKIRKGLFPSVGAMRETGTTVIIEDVAFPVPRLAEATLDLQALFVKHGYPDTIIFGHALEGNLHFVFKQDFNHPAEVDRYRRFMDDVTALVVKKYDGALKAEHGTGRNMTPFLEFEWGAEAVQIMKEIKALFDPEQLLNPGVILNDDPTIHIKNLKPLPAAHELVDKCIECGFCEPHCVANHLTLSARQRIVAYREMSRLKSSGEDPHRLQTLARSYAYQGEQTCATDGLCALACPVDIDTGQLIKTLRHDQAGAPANWLARMIGRNMTRVTALARLGLGLVDGFHRILGARLFSALTSGVRKLSFNAVPLWNASMPRGAAKIRGEAVKPGTDRQVVYFASCITRSMGPARADHQQTDLVQKTEALLSKAGYEIIYPPNLDELCCGMAFASKGFKEAGDRKAKELEQSLLQASDNGRIPVLCDMSPCLLRMKETLDKRLKLYEPIEFTLTCLAPYLAFTKVPRTVAVHAVCSAKKMGLEEKLVQLASMCAEKVVAPESNCCGFAGDRGFSHPELNAHGLQRLKEQLPADCRHGYSTSRTCEIGLSHHGEISYQSILYLVDEATAARNL